MTPKIFLVAALVAVATFKGSVAQNGVCFRTTYGSQGYTAHRTEYYTFSSSCGWWGWSRCRTGAERSVAYTAYRQITGSAFACCSGYRQSGSSCSPICVPDCDRGDCVTPNTCLCDFGYTGSRCQEAICEPFCDHGDCVLPNTCLCDVGFTGSRCREDINECDFDSGGCEQLCSNSYGSFFCTCNSGYTLLRDGYSCEDIDECELNNGNCAQECRNFRGSHQCSCQTGFDFGTVSTGDPTNAGRPCFDVNECLSLNGGCQHVCFNTIGSYVCSCNNGYQLATDGRSCEDVDECAIGADNCTTLAECENEIGFFRCVCPLGYELDGSYAACIDIDECQMGTSGCSQFCSNEIGSYTCSCSESYILANDQRGCLDIDECLIDNGGCDHFCVNTVGSFECECSRGFSLQSDNAACFALECPLLDAPLNGSASIGCAGRTTGSVCKIDCDVGFRLLGSATRFCTPSSTWTGTIAFCLPLLCDALAAPANGAILAPCFQDFGSSCTLVCMHGYVLDGPSQQTCVLVNDELAWTQQSQCLASSPCEPNPCQHSGSCITVDIIDFECNCNGTGYEGLTCSTGVLMVPFIPTLISRTRSMYTVSGRPDETIEVEFNHQSGVDISPAKVKLNSTQTRMNFTVTSRTPNYYLLQYLLSGPSAVDFQSPDDSAFLVRSNRSSGSGDLPKYFQSLGQRVPGLLVESCCSSPPLLYSGCPMSTETIRFVSSCNWTGSAQLADSTGVVFARYKGLSLPLSVSGVNITSTIESISILTSQDPLDSCEICETSPQVIVTAENPLPSGSDECYFYKYGNSDLESFLTSHALAITYFEHISVLLPSWITLSYPSRVMESPQITSHDFSTSLVEQTDLSSIDGCTNIDPDYPGLYSVFKHTRQFEVEIFDDFVLYDGETSGVCVAVSLCQDLQSPLYIDIPASAQNILKQMVAQSYLRDGWQFSIYSVALYGAGKTVDFNQNIWNGSDFYSPELPSFDVKWRTDLDILLNIPGFVTSARLLFSGTILYVFDHNEEKTGLLEGSLELELMTEIGGANCVLQLQSPSSSTGVFSATEDGEDLCHQGLSKLMVYTPRAEEPFYSIIFSLEEVTTMCDMHVFLHTDSDVNMKAVRMQSKCPRLMLNRLLFPRMTHTLFFGDFDFHANCTPELGVLTDPALVILSSLQDDQVSLGNFYKAFPDANSIALSVEFLHNTPGFKAQLHNVEVSLLNTVIRTPIVIEQGILGFTAMANIDDSYPATISVESRTDAPWERTVLKVHGEMLDSFRSDVQRYVNNHVIETVVQGAMQREMLADSALESTIEALELLESRLMERQEGLSEADTAVQEAMDMVRAANETLIASEDSFASANTRLQTIQRNLDLICDVDACLPTQVCTDEITETFRDVFIEENGTCQVSGTVEKEFEEVRFDIVEVWRFEQYCYPVCERSCGIFFSSRRCRTVCRGICVRGYESIPIRETVIKTVTEVVNEGCTIQRYNSTIVESVLSRVCRRIPETRIPCVQACRMSQQLAIMQLEEELATPFRTLDNTRMDFAIARTTLSKATARRVNAQQMLDKIIPPYETAQMTRNISERNYDAVVREIRGELQLAELFNDLAMPQIIFENITFNIIISTLSPEQIPLQFKYNIPILNQSFEMTILFDLSRTFELNLRRIAEEISSRLLNRTSVNKRNVETRWKRQDDQEISEKSPNALEFEAKCAELNNLRKYIQRLTIPLKDSINNTLEARRIISETLSQLRNKRSDDASNYQDMINFEVLQEKFNVSADIDFQGDDEVTASYEDFLQDLIYITANVSNLFDETAFIDWQAAMMMLHDQLNAVAGYPCSGFSDCLATAASILKQLITDNTQKGTEELLQQLALIESEVYNVGTTINITVEDAFDALIQFSRIANSDILENYWCSSLPEITVSPPLQLNISQGDDLLLNCSAESTLQISYHWRKNNIPIANAQFDTLLIRRVQMSDQGNYSCHVASDIGSVSSFASAVLVYELPEFFLEPVSISVRAGDENGALFTCNATSWPYPGWRWFYRETENNEWQILDGEEINEINITNPQQENAGYYTCEAYTYHGVLRAAPAYLTILPISVSQLSISVSFEILPQPPAESCDEIPEESVVAFVSQNIDLLTTSIVDIVSMKGEVCIITLTIASHNATTETSSYTSFMDIENVALPSRRDLLTVKKSFQTFIQNADVAIAVVASSLTFGVMTYMCPPGQELRSDFLLCVACAPGSYQTNIERARVYSGEGLRERYPVCTPCPFNHYEDRIGSIGCQSCPDYHQTRSAGANSSSLCYVEPLLFECGSEGSNTTQVTITCGSNRPTTRVLCSFDGRREHECDLPLLINQRTSFLAGQHSVMISAVDAFGYHVQQTVNYVLADEEKTNYLPSLGVHFINDSPRVVGDTVEVDFELTRPAAVVTCQLNKEEKINCSSGHVVYTGLLPGKYSVRVAAVNSREDRAIVKRQFQIQSDPEICTMHLINEGVVVTNNNVAIEFTVVGPAVVFTCQLDDQAPFSCEKTLTLHDVSDGEHRFRATPEGGCSKYRKLSLKFVV